MRYRPRSKFLITPVITSALLLSTINLFAADSFYTLELALKQDSNVGLGFEEPHIKEDNVIEVYADYGISKSLGAGKSLIYTVSAEYAGYDNYPNIDRIDFGGNVTYQQIIGVGENVPTFSIGAGLKRRESESNLRSAWLFSFSTGVRQRLSERWDASASINYLKENADAPKEGKLPSFPEFIDINYNAFDIENTEFALQAEYAVSDNNYLSLGYTFRDGEVSSVGEIGEAIERYATAGVYDAAFDPTGGLKPEIWSYRIDVESHIFSIGWDYILNDRSSVGLSVDLQESATKDGVLEYDRDVVRLKYVYGR